ncbi:MAG: hypothetical protein ACXVHX_28170 [Solirubrobacteraceae bacterium]
MSDASVPGRIAVMKLQATIVITYQARSLADAGAILDDVLERPREREDVDVESVQLHTPIAGPAVSLPHITHATPPPATAPHPVPSTSG